MDVRLGLLKAAYGGGIVDLVGVAFLGMDMLLHTAADGRFEGEGRQYERVCSDENDNGDKT